MGGWTGIWQWVVVLAIVLLLFGGRGKISALMGDFGKGLKSFKKSMNGDEELAADEEPKVLKSERTKITETAPKGDQEAKG
ncbi:MAG: twin-arginine translocase TatA/TatE family subunit [Rhodospirillales bacterium]